MVIERKRHLMRVRALLRESPVVAILGARQTGKTTLAHEAVREAKRVTRFDLEAPRSAPVGGRPTRPQDHAIRLWVSRGDTLRKKLATLNPPRT